MARPIPHCVPPTWPPLVPDSRFASSIRRDSPDGCSVALIGLPDDLGVRLNGGRPGAREGPSAVRAALARYGAKDSMAGPMPAVYDAGDVAPADGADASALARTHDRVTEAVRAVVDLGLFPIAIGGGHDLTYAFVRAVASKFSPLRGVSFDAHLDVRETAGSGMTFRRLLEEGHATRITVRGLSELVNDRAHADFAASRGVTVVRSARLDHRSEGAPFFASFDLDVIDASAAPGVSAGNPCGWTSAEGEAWVRRIGGDPGVRCFDIMELSPPHDQDQRTARLAAHLFLTFLSAMHRRSA